MDFMKIKLKKILKLMPQIDKNDKILDIGCEYGPVTAFLHEKGYDIKGIDIDPKVIKEAKKKHPNVKFEVGDLYKVYFGKVYKVFIVWGVFEFVLDLKKLLKNIETQMNPGSCLIFAVPNICSLSTRCRCLVGLNPNRDETNFKTYTFKQMEKLIESLKFRKKEITSLNIDCMKNICFPMPKTLSTVILVKLVK